MCELTSFILGELTNFYKFFINFSINRGPGSTSSTNPVVNSAAYKTAATDYNTKPLTFPDTKERSKYTDMYIGNNNNNNIEKDYNKRQLQQGTAQGYGEDRISIGE